jgi:hypothetical protein
LNDDGLASLRCFRNLQVLELRCAQIATNAGLSALTQMGALKTLALNVFMLEDSPRLWLDDTLRALDLFGAQNLGPRFLRRIWSLTNLTSLGLVFIDGTYDLTPVQRLVNLEDLDFSGMDCVQETFVAMRALPRLKKLVLQDMVQLWLHELAGHPTLRDLDLRSSWISDGDLASFLTVLPALEVCDLEGCEAEHTVEKQLGIASDLELVSRLTQLRPDVQLKF